MLDEPHCDRAHGDRHAGDCPFCPGSMLDDDGFCQCCLVRMTFADPAEAAWEEMATGMPQATMHCDIRGTRLRLREPRRA